MRSYPQHLRQTGPQEYMRARSGFALFIALGAMIVIGALIVGVHFSSNQDFRSGRNTLVQEQALAAAEHGQNKVVANWNLAWNALKNGDTVSSVDTVDAATRTIATVRITKLNDQTFFLQSTGVSGTAAVALAQRKTGELVRLAMPNLPFPGALTTDSTTLLSGTATLSGADAAPSGWNCPPLAAAHAGLAINTATNASGSGTCATLANCSTGSTPVLATPTAADSSTYFNYGGLTWAQLTSSADKVYAAGTSLTSLAPSTTTGTLPGLPGTGTVCNTSDTKNWGDVNRNAVTPGPCESYFPIIYAQGDLTISSGSGQGMLLVQGNLRLNGNITFYGPIIVRGSISTFGTGNKVVGGVMAYNQGCVYGNGTATCNQLAGTTSIQYSSCAILNAFKNKVYVVAPKRAWLDLF
ncbi:MAG: hypothetical protein NVS4B3_27710 [Gemmatimonadaceae bacterium]